MTDGYNADLNRILNLLLLAKNSKAADSFLNLYSNNPQELIYFYGRFAILIISGEASKAFEESEKESMISQENSGLNSFWGFIQKNRHLKESKAENLLYTVALWLKKTGRINESLCVVRILLTSKPGFHKGNMLLAELEILNKNLCGGLAIFAKVSKSEIHI